MIHQEGLQVSRGRLHATHQHLYTGFMRRLHFLCIICIGILRQGQKANQSCTMVNENGIDEPNKTRAVNMTQYAVCHPHSHRSLTCETCVRLVIALRLRVGQKRGGPGDGWITSLFQTQSWPQNALPDSAERFKERLLLLQTQNRSI